MLAQLAQSELALKKSRLGANTSQAELDNYETLSNSIKQRLETAKTGIEDSKEAFVRAREVRKNRMEYNAMAGVILQQPDRKQMLEKLEQIKTELTELEVSINFIMHSYIIRLLHYNQILSRQKLVY
jgi:THO complex subunit 7